MNNNLIRTGLLPLALLTLSTMAKAQISVRDTDNEARNAYQVRCFALNPSVASTTCTLPALPPDNRLAIRYIAISCSETGSTRNHLLTLTGGLSGGETHFLNLFPRRASTITGPKAFLSEPIYFHTDRPPQITVSWEGDGQLGCNVHIIGYLVSKQ
jgi:hypothetical protein